MCVYFFSFMINRKKKKKTARPPLHMNWEAKILKNPNLATPCCCHNHQTPRRSSQHLNCTVWYCTWAQTDWTTPSWCQFLLWPGGTTGPLFIGLRQWGCLVSDWTRPGGSDCNVMAVEVFVRMRDVDRRLFGFRRLRTFFISPDVDMGVLTSTYHIFTIGWYWGGDLTTRVTKS